MNFLDPRVPMRFWDKLIPCPMSGCWLWIASTTLQGYGHLWTGGGVSVGRYTVAHRHIYELLVGPIPVDLDADHLCRNTLCCNPLHLEPVTHAENVRRSGATVIAQAASALKQRARTHCANGHEFTAVNTYVAANGARVCRTCHAARERRRRETHRRSA